MTDVPAVVDLLVSHALANHGDEIDLIGYYGSRARGDHRDDSDLDIFYIPAEDKDPPVGRTFLLGGVLFDFWRISWNTMEGFASGRLRGWAFAPALVHHTKILHARSEESTERFARLKQLVLDLQRPEARPGMVERALAMFGHVMWHLGNLRLAAEEGDLADVRFGAWQVIRSSWECLALANQVFFDRGLIQGLDELHRLVERPPDMERLIETIATSDDVRRVLAAAEELALSTRRILLDAQRALPPQSTIRAQFEQAYPEIKDMVGGLRRACEQGRPVAASAQAWLLQSDLSTMLSRTEGGGGRTDFNLYCEFAAAYRRSGLPNLLALTSGSLDDLAGQARRLDESLREWLTAESLSLQEYQDLDELRRSL